MQMNGRPRLPAILLGVLLAAGPARTGAAAAAPAHILVSAAASLTDAVTTIAHEYERTTGTRVSLNFGPSSGLARQIVNGAPVDLFLSADEAQMDYVARAHLVRPGTRVDLLSNQLVVVMPDAEARPLKSLRDLLGPGFKRIAVGDPAAVPVGVYTRKYLTSLGLWSRIQPKIVPTLDVRAALAAVDGGNVDAAFVYRTDAAIARHSRMVYAVPLDQGPRIVYPLALIAGAPDAAAATRFYTYLRGPQARAVFEWYGFLAAGHVR